MFSDTDLDRTDRRLRDFRISRTKHHDTETSLFQDFDALLKAYRSLSSELEEVRDSRDRHKRRARAGERSPFAVVIVDGNGYIFDEDNVQNGEHGGQLAAAALDRAVKRSMMRHGIENCSVVVRVYADLARLSRTLHERRLCGATPRALGPFAAAFTAAQPFYDFVDVGEGRDAVASKVSAYLQQNVDNPQCAHVFFAACHDTVYLPDLSRCVEDHKERITLIRNHAFSPEYSNLLTGIEDFAGVFSALSSAPYPVSVPMSPAPLSAQHTGNSHKDLGNGGPSGWPPVRAPPHKICFSMQKFGKCKFGDMCKYNHDVDAPPQQHWRASEEHTRNGNWLDAKAVRQGNGSGRADSVVEGWGQTPPDRSSTPRASVHSPTPSSVDGWGADPIKDRNATPRPDTRPQSAASSNRPGKRKQERAAHQDPQPPTPRQPAHHPPLSRAQEQQPPPSPKRAPFSPTPQAPTRPSQLQAKQPTSPSLPHAPPPTQQTISRIETWRAPLTTPLDFSTLPSFHNTTHLREIPINESGHRLDRYISRPNPLDLDAFERRSHKKRLCNRYQISGWCPAEDACVFDHRSVSAQMLNVIRFMAATIPCRRGGKCRRLDCTCGHVCQRSDCVSRGGSWSGCRLGGEAHVLDIEVADWVEGENPPLFEEEGEGEEDGKSVGRGREDGEGWMDGRGGGGGSGGWEKTATPPLQQPVPERRREANIDIKDWPTTFAQTSLGRRRSWASMAATEQSEEPSENLMLLGSEKEHVEAFMKSGQAGVDEVSNGSMNGRYDGGGGRASDEPADDHMGWMD